MTIDEENSEILVRARVGEQPPSAVTDALEALAAAVAAFESDDDEVTGFSFSKGAGLKLGGDLRPGGGSGPYVPPKQDFCGGYFQGDDGKTESCWVDWR